MPQSRSDYQRPKRPLAINGSELPEVKDFRGANTVKKAEVGGTQRGASDSTVLPKGKMGPKPNSVRPA